MGSPAAQAVLLIFREGNFHSLLLKMRPINWFMAELDRAFYVARAALASRNHGRIQAVGTDLVATRELVVLGFCGRFAVLAD